jgi:predicted TIM-barrel enzyme
VVIPPDGLLVLHNAAGRGLAYGLLPLHDANAVTLDLLRRRPGAVAGLCASDPFRDPERLLAEVKELGAVGVINLPSVGLIDGQFGRDLEAAGLGYAKEVEFLRRARRAGLVSFGLAFDAEQAALMTPVVDALVAPRESKLPGALVLEKDRILKEG